MGGAPSWERFLGTGVMGGLLLFFLPGPRGSSGHPGPMWGLPVGLSQRCPGSALPPPADFWLLAFHP